MYVCGKKGLVCCVWQPRNRLYSCTLTTILSVGSKYLNRSASIQLPKFSDKMNHRQANAELPPFQKRNFGFHASWPLNLADCMKRMLLLLIIVIGSLKTTAFTNSIDDTFVFNSQPEAESNITNIKYFLSAQRLQISNCIVSRSWCYYFNNGKQFTNNVFYDASFQSNTYYIKQFGVSYSPDDTNKSTVSGMSFEDEWFRNEYNQVTLVSRNKVFSGTNTPPEKDFRNRIDAVEEILNLGILQVNRSTIVWSNNTFSADSMLPDRFGTISGSLHFGDHKRPDFLLYSFSKRKGLSYKVIFEYLDDGLRPQWLPYKTILSITSPKFDSKANARKATNTIEALTIGVRDVGNKGYTYKSFLPSSIIESNLTIVVYSNSTPFLKSQNGFIKVVQPSEIVTHDGSKVFLVRIVLAIVFVLGVFALGFFLWLGRHSNN